MADVKVPALAESVTEGEIGAWLKKDGERVKKNEPILELQTDKASLEIAAEADGVLRTLRAEGEVVKVGDVVGRIEAAGESGPADTAGAPEKERRATTDERAAAPASQAAPPESATAPAKGDRAKRAPSARGASVAAETKPDTRDAEPAGAAPKVAAAPPPSPPRADAAEASTATAPRPTEAPRGEEPQATRAPDEPGTRRERMSMLRRRIAERLVEAQRQAAILTTFNEIDMSAAMELREKHQEWFTKRYGVKLGYMSIFARAVIGALREIPVINASIDGQDVVYHDFVHLGIAVQTDKGLVVPIVRDAGAMGVGALEKEIARLAALARAGKVGVHDLQGGTFTISNGGIFGSLLSTPILNPPQTGILGMHAIQRRPICLPDGSIVGRPMMYVALSYDHRLVDGRDAVTFLVRIKQRLEDPGRLILES